MDIQDNLTQAIRTLTHAGIKTASLDAKILLEKAIGKDRSFITAHGEYDLDAKEQVVFLDLLEKRRQRQPISQIIGKKEFWGLDFEVTKDVLTPRPETEFIIEAALSLFKRDEAINILDLGTGSGCVILSLLHEFKQAKGFACDISHSALAIAKRNAYSLDIQNAEFIHSDWCKNLDNNFFISKLGNRGNLDLIVSNPPYIPQPERLGLDAELSYEPENALFAGENGFDCYENIAIGIKDLNFKYAIFEIGINQENKIEEIFRKVNIRLIESLKDLAGITRTLIFQKL